MIAYNTACPDRFPNSFCYNRDASGVDILIELRNRIDKSVYESNEQADPPSIAKPSDDDCRIFSPIPIRGKGHPPFEREVSGVEVVAERKKESVRKQVNTVTSLSLL